MKNLTITIEGRPSMGKSTMADRIASMLITAGATVDIKEEGIPARRIVNREKNLAPVEDVYVTILPKTKTEYTTDNDGLINAINMTHALIKSSPHSATITETYVEHLLTLLKIQLARIEG